MFKLAHRSRIGLKTGIRRAATDVTGNSGSWHEGSLLVYAIYTLVNWHMQYTLLTGGEFFALPLESGSVQHTKGNYGMTLNR